MSKYQKLDSALAATMHDDDYDESFSLYLDDNQQQQLEQQQQHNNNNSDHIRLNIVGSNRSAHKPNGHHKYNNLSNNNIDFNSTRTTATATTTTTRGDALELDEHTWEVPLLRSSSSNNSCNNLHLEHEATAAAGGDGGGNGSGDREWTRRGCRSSQPGFGANLKSKSAQEAKFKILLAISLCCIFMIIEFLGGYMAGSLAIMADAAHLASDCISFVIGLVAIWLGTRPPDSRMSFGYKRFEVLGALVSILGIWLLTAMLVVVAIERIYSQQFELDVNVMMCISAIGIGINIIMMFVLHGSWFMGGSGHGHSHSHSHSHSHGYGHGHGHDHAQGNEEGHNVVIANGLKPSQHNGTTERNLNLRAAMIHVIGDLVQSIGVFLASVLIKFYPSAKYADPLCTLLFSVIVVMTTVQLFRESISILLDAVPHHVCLKTLQHELASITGVKSVHHLNVWQHTSEHSVLMAHLVVDLLCDSDTVLELATQLTCGSKYNIKHATIQIERLTE
ncbi:zinc transporter 2 [Drosophila innubila]|uniref:zinc transporter 2 n=1 Tax=Drosophila innubila TaxID=198719 RepID=UPI00148D4AD6|nr:zinc transporter 2 [Drosophila innubila]XP_034479780.1 zinc transporter 2 [Drosophila innubila]XP_034479781.1 zinc transporter 2 [Drosophila innubila]